MSILANVVIPTVAGHIVVMVVMLLPIALIEAGVLSRRHSLRYGESLRLSLWANVKSTFVGLPLGYVFAWLGLIPAGFFAGVLPETIRSSIRAILFNALLAGGIQPTETQLDQITPLLGTLLVMIPYFLVTLYVERRAIVKHRSELDTPRLRTSVRIMNDITYGLLVLLVVAAIVHEWMELAPNN